MRPWPWQRHPYGALAMESGAKCVQCPARQQQRTIEGVHVANARVRAAIARELGALQAVVAG
eukprot:CAMPEP_0176293050 /NCGR_PEP_ID=MMETSP0121_2-20121125/56405_1 /TAXON_ID=160619 /ORGANISM="Kryptoperidinium foliaceum, Strain CCMP 1326" /LENGTH=61 /DNA_ID=CAMNT_0017633993 /DNA_START=193 /DNA_END=375 /DNA_ORIENTATION=+